MRGRNSTGDVLGLLDAIDGLLGLVKKPAPETSEAPPHRHAARLGFVREPTPQERFIVEKLNQHLMLSLLITPYILVTRRDEALTLHISTETRAPADEARLELKLRSYQKEVLDARDPANQVVFHVNGKVLDTREARRVKEIDLFKLLREQGLDPER